MKSVRTQLDYLARFADQVRSGVQRLDGTLRRRAELYVLSAKGVFEDVRQKVHAELGHTEMRRTLHAKESCPDCVGYAAQGWQPIGSLPLPTEESQCGNRCECQVAYQ